MSIVASIALAVYGALLIGIVCWKGVAKMRRDLGIFGLLVVACFIHAMASKPTGPVIKWDSDYIRNNGSHYTNENTVARFKWAKVDQTVPNATPLHISRSPLNVTNWTDVATTTVGAFTYDLAISSTNFMYYLWLDYAPSPVHTNGVWLGNFIEKANGDTGLNKIIIIKGELRQNGKVIAP